MASVGEPARVAQLDAADRDRSMAAASADRTAAERPAALGETLCDASDDGAVDFLVFGSPGDINGVKADRMIRESGFRTKVVLAGRGAGGRSGDCALREELLAFTGRRAVPVVFDVRGGRQELVGGMAELLTHLQRRQDLGGAPGAAGPTIGGVRL